MFDNIGGKIKKLAVILCIIGIIASVIGALFLWITASRVRYGYGTTYVIYGFVVLIGGFLTSWIGSFGLYAFGTITENSDYLVEQNREIIDLLHSNSVGKTSNSKLNLNSVSSAPVSTTASKDPWTCKSCGSENPADARTCRNCGAPR